MLFNNHAQDSLPLHSFPGDHHFVMAPLTPTLDPIPDDHEGDAYGPKEKPLPETFGGLSLEEYPSPMRQPNPLIQMPQPRAIPKYQSPSTILNSSRPMTPQQQHKLRPTARNNSFPNTFSPPRSISPLRSPHRVRSPFRSSVDDVYSASAMSPEISSISEDAELEITPRSRHNSMNNLSFTSANLGFHRPLRHRTLSPMRSMRASSVPASPIRPTRYNESFPPDLTYSRSSSFNSNSVPSTPTSARSRSPSISSLETIPDTPDEESRAMEADRRDREARSTMWDLYGTQSQPARSGGFGSKDKRKRWSVCGAEKRSDLNLETIWED